MKSLPPKLRASILKMRVGYWKWKLREAVAKRRKILNEADSIENIVRPVGPEFRYWDDKYHEAMDWLRENDPEFPKEFKP